MIRGPKSSPARLVNYTTATIYDDEYPDVPIRSPEKRISFYPRPRDCKFSVEGYSAIETKSTKMKLIASRRRMNAVGAVDSSSKGVCDVTEASDLVSTENRIGEPDHFSRGIFKHDAPILCMAINSCSEYVTLYTGGQVRLE